jgi:plasmid maintenance system killer protein
VENAAVEVRFATRQLERRYRNRSEAIRAWGPVVGVRYIERVGYLFQAPLLSDIYDNRAFRLHALTGDRAGQHALVLTGQMRLILTVLNESSVLVEDVVDYHD